MREQVANGLIADPGADSGIGDSEFAEKAFAIVCLEPLREASQPIGADGPADNAGRCPRAVAVQVLRRLLFLVTFFTYSPLDS